jgi:hypothetical protein
MILFHPEQLIYEIMNNLMTNMIYFWYWRQTTATKEAINRRQKKASYHLLVTTILLLKKLTIQRDSIDLLTLIASMTLSAKYQHSQPQIIDYDLIAQSCQIENIQLIHVSLSSFFILLFIYSFYYRMLNLIFSMFSPIIFLWQHFLFVHIHLIIVFYSDLLHNYPSSIVTPSLICNITSNTFICQQIKSFLLHKKLQYIT